MFLKFKEYILEFTLVDHSANHQLQKSIINLCHYLQIIHFHLVRIFQYHLDYSSELFQKDLFNEFS